MHFENCADIDGFLKLGHIIISLVFVFVFSKVSLWPVLELPSFAFLLQKGGRDQNSFVDTSIFAYNENYHMNFLLKVDWLVVEISTR